MMQKLSNFQGSDRVKLLTKNKCIMEVFVTFDQEMESGRAHKQTNVESYNIEGTFNLFFLPIAKVCSTRNTLFSSIAKVYFSRNEL